MEDNTGKKENMTEKDNLIVVEKHRLGKFQIGNPDEAILRVSRDGQSSSGIIVNREEAAEIIKKLRQHFGL